MSSHRQTMGLASEEDLQEVKITHLNKKAQGRKQELIDAIEDNDQDGAFQDIGDHGFQIEYKKGTLCNFPITITKFWGEVPKPTTTSSKVDHTPAAVPKEKNLQNR